LHIAQANRIITVPGILLISGHAQDSNGIRSIRWQLDDGSLGEATITDAKPDQAAEPVTWELAVPLPDQTTQYQLIITAEDNVGRTTSGQVSILVDNTVPLVNVLEPSTNFLRLLWQEPSIAVDVLGLSIDVDTAVQRVEWRLEDGDYTPAVPTKEDWSEWQFTATISDKNIRWMEVRAVDVVGNTSEPERLTLDIREVV
ncbi:MAG: hypothetical protein KDJ52_33395, partial [Anaerolineae bacterium]|nr:hypothetical protein [Anaerolineae bacterium]